jgi:CBS domain-containing protein
MSSKVKQLITKKPVTVTKGTRTIDAVILMSHHNIGSVVIVAEDGKPIGIFTERDLLHAVAKNRDLNLPIEELGTVTKLITIKEDEPIINAARLMHEYNVRHLVVVNKDGKLVGVISIRDLINETHVLSAISTIEDSEWVGGD